MNLTISERNINVNRNATSQLDDTAEFADVSRRRITTEKSSSSELDVHPFDSKIEIPNEALEKPAFSRARRAQNSRKRPKKLGSSAPKKSFEKIVSTLSITADKITPLPLKLDEIPLEDADEGSREETTINFDALNKALSWDRDKDWNDPSSSDSGSTDDDSVSDSTDYGEDDRASDMRSGSFEEVAIGGGGEVLSRSTGHRVPPSFSPDHVEAQPTGPRRPRRRGGGFRSLLLLGLLLLVAVLALLTLSQVVLVEHRVLDHLGHDQLQPALPLRPGRALQRILTVAMLGGAGHSKDEKRQFKIEPLLNREAPSVEVNLARTLLKKVWTPLSTLILEESLSVFHLREHALQRNDHQSGSNSSRHRAEHCWEYASSHDKRKCVITHAAESKSLENEEHGRQTTSPYGHENKKYTEARVKERASIKMTASLRKLDEQIMKGVSTILTRGTTKAESVHTILKDNEMFPKLSELLKSSSKSGGENFRYKDGRDNQLNLYMLTNNDKTIYNKSSLLKHDKRTSASGRILTVGIEKNSKKTGQTLLDRRKNSDRSNLKNEEKSEGCRSEYPCKKKHNHKRTKDKPKAHESAAADTQAKHVAVEPNYSDVLAPNAADHRSAMEPDADIVAVSSAMLNYSVNDGDFPELSPGNEPFGIYREDDESIMEVLEQSSFMGNFPEEDDSLDHEEVSVIDIEKEVEDNYENIDAMYKDFLGSGVDLPLHPQHEIERRFQSLDKLPREQNERGAHSARRNKKKAAHRPKLKKFHTYTKSSKIIHDRSVQYETKEKTTLKPSINPSKGVPSVQNKTRFIPQSSGLPVNPKTSKSGSAQFNSKKENIRQNETSISRNLPLCPEVPPHLRGRLPLAFPHLGEDSVVGGLLRNLSWVSPGGSWSPLHSPHDPCIPRHRVAVIVPYRDRVQHLALSLSWLHHILRAQQLEYTIFVAEQVANVTFNKGSVMNAGFLEAFTTTNAQCFVFHDVDMLAEDDRNMYSCPPRPRHLSVGVDTLQYRLPYFLLVGGVLAVRGDHFLKANGYSNMYWGWGGEDDDMGYRLVQSKLGILRPVQTVARYSMIPHLKRPPLTWQVRGKLVRTSSRRYRLDGLNTLQYRLVSRSLRSLYTHLLLDVGTPPTDIVSLTAA